VFDTGAQDGCGGADPSLAAGWILVKIWSPFYIWEKQLNVLFLVSV
jgi:hypothetical protein